MSWALQVSPCRRGGRPGARGRRRCARGPRPTTARPGRAAPRPTGAPTVTRDVDAVEQRAAEPALVAREVGRRAAARAPRPSRTGTGSTRRRACTRVGNTITPLARGRSTTRPSSSGWRSASSAGRGELGQLVEEEHAVVGERGLAGRRRARRRRPARTARSCGAARGTAARSTSPPPPCSPAIEWMRVTSIASSRRQRRQQRRAAAGRASSCPCPGGPCRKRLWPPAAATSSAGIEPVVAADVARGPARRRLGGRRRRGLGSGSGAGSRSPRSTSTASCSVSTPSDLERRRTSAASRARARGTTAAGRARGARAPSAIASAPRIGRTSPVSDSSPTTAQPARRLGRELPAGGEHARSPAAGRSPGRPCAGRPARG